MVVFEIVPTGHRVPSATRGLHRREGRYGWLRYDVTAGQIFGTVPYPSLYVFQGNQTWGYIQVGASQYYFLQNSKASGSACASTPGVPVDTTKPLPPSAPVNR